MSFLKLLLGGMMGGHHGRGGYGGGHHGGGRGGYPDRYDQNFRNSPAGPPGVECAKCGALNADGVRFCQQCGASLGPTKCASCAGDISPTAKFCPNCGKPK